MHRKNICVQPKEQIHLCQGFGLQRDHSHVKHVLHEAGCACLLLRGHFVVLKSRRFLIGYLNQHENDDTASRVRKIVLWILVAQVNPPFWQDS